MLKDIAQGKVLPEYTDEALSQDREVGFSGEMRELLLRAPAEQRQNVVVALWDVVMSEEYTNMSVRQLMNEGRMPSQILAKIITENGW